MAYGMMTAKSPKRVTPKTGDDFDNTKKIAGAQMPSRDGPVQREADPKAQKPMTSAKSKPMAKPNMAKTAPAAKAPMQSMMPQGTMSMPPSMPMSDKMKSRIASMKKSLKK